MKKISKHLTVALFALVCSVALFMGIRTLFIDDNPAATKHTQQLQAYLAPRLLEEVMEFNGRIGIALYDLNSGESLYINAQETFPAASLIKIPIMLEVFHQYQERRITSETIVTYNVYDRVGGFGKMQNYALGTRFRVGELLEWMITLSDNDATRALMRTVGPERLNNDLKKWGFTVTELKSHLPASFPEAARVNQTTAAEMLRLFLMIFNKDLFTPQNQALMIRTLEQQSLNEEMPRYLPAAIPMGHKTGMLGNVIHDAGIVTLYDRRYILCVLSQGNMGMAEQTNCLGRISRVVYNYFSYNRGPFLLAAGGQKRRTVSVLLLTGRSYPPSVMKDMAEALYAQGYSVYCLPYPPHSGIDIEKDRARVDQGLALLQRYTKDQVIICPSVESIPLLAEPPTASTKGIIVFPHPREGTFVKKERYARLMVPLKKRLRSGLDTSLLTQVYSASMLTETISTANTTPLLFMTSPKFHRWISPHLPAHTSVNSTAPAELTNWSTKEYGQIIDFIRSCEKR